MSITYSTSSLLIIISGEANCNFESLYQASVTGSWGVVSKIGNTQYTLTRRLLISNSTFTDYGKQIVLDNTIYSSSIITNITLNGSTKFTLGKVASVTNRTGWNGCSIFIQNDYQGYTNIIDNAASASLYACNFYLDNKPSGRLRGSGYYQIWGNSFIGNVAIMQTTNPNNDIYNCFTYKTTEGSFGVIGDISNMVWNDVVYAVYNVLGTVRDCTFNNIGYVANPWNATANIIDAITNTWNIFWHPTNSTDPLTKINRGYTVKPTLIDISGSFISGASVKMIDVSGSVKFDLLTDTNGTISSQDVYIGYYNKANNNVLQSLNPMTLIVSKSGYETYTSTFDLIEKYRSIITLTLPEYVYLDRITEVQQISIDVIEENALLNLTNENIYSNIVNDQNIISITEEINETGVVNETILAEGE